MNKKFKIISKHIHKCLHSDSKGLVIEGISCPVTVSINGCRYLKYQNKIFIQQDPKKWGSLAIRAAGGERITRIVRSGRPWGYITDTEIHDPLNGE